MKFGDDDQRPRRLGTREGAFVIIVKLWTMRQIHIGLFLVLGASCTAQVSTPEQDWLSSSPSVSPDTARVRVTHYLNDSINESIELLPNNLTLLYEYYASGKVRSWCYSTIIITTDSLIAFDAKFHQADTVRQSLRPVRNGYYVELREDGSTIRDGYYFSGNKQGEWKEYDLKGQVTKTTLYSNGKAVPR